MVQVRHGGAKSWQHSKMDHDILDQINGDLPDLKVKIPLSEDVDLKLNIKPNLEEETPQEVGAEIDIKF